MHCSFLIQICTCLRKAAKKDYSVVIVIASIMLTFRALNSYLVQCEQGMTAEVNKGSPKKAFIVSATATYQEETKSL